MTEAVNAPSTITVTSEAFVEGGTVPRRYTCDGPGTSPPLAWSGVPTGAAALALVVDDPDAPSGTFTHWVLLDLPPSTRSIPEGVTPPGVQARNSAGKAAWMGPCPPSGTHHYRFTVVALRSPTGLRDGAALADALEAVRGGALAQGRLTATYRRSH
ncbi:YbhB/YbcL family Raf kinase inhibitor-like protein [Phycicoccus ginsengisoli]